MTHEKVLIPHEKVLKRHELIIILMQRRKHIFWSLCCWIDALRVQSRKNNSENLNIFRGAFKTKNFKKIKFSEFFFSDFTPKTPHPALGPKKRF